MAIIIGRLLTYFIFRPLSFVSQWMSPRTARDPHIESLQATRAWLGYLGLAALLVANRQDKDFDGTLQSFVQTPLLKAAIALPAFLIAGAVLVATTHGGSRRSMAWHVIKPWLTAIAITAVPILLFLAAVFRFNVYEHSADANDSLWFVIFLVVALPLLPAALWTQFLAVRYSFKAADVHPFMPALVGSAIAVFSVAKSAVDVSQAVTPLDRNLGLLSLGGGLVVGALCAYEFRYLHQQGVHWHTSPAVSTHGPAVRMSQWIPRVVVPALIIIVGPSVQLAHGTTQSAVEMPATQTLGATVTSSPAAHRSPTATPGRLAPKPPTRISGVRVRADSTAPPGQERNGKKVLFSPNNMVDGNPTTAWRAVGDAAGQRVVLSFAHPVRIVSVGLIPGYAKTDPTDGTNWFPLNRRIVSVTWSVPGKKPVSQKFEDEPKLQTTQFKTAATTAMTVTITRTRAGGLTHDFTAISEIGVWGTYTVQ